MSQQAVSHHLAVLRSAGLVVERRDGTKYLHVMNADGMRFVQEYLGGFWPAQMSNLKRAAEDAASKRVVADYSTSIDIAAPPDIVYAHLVTVDGWLAWMGQHAEIRAEPISRRR